MIRISDYDAVLFDLDGTLLDTAPEFIAAIERLRAESEPGPVASAAVRAAVSQGARAMLRAAFPAWDDRDDALLTRFLALYRERLGEATAVFPGVPEVLARLDRVGKPWGIVTNKPQSLTEPLLEGLALSPRAQVIVCGDTLARAKPHPDPVLHACRLLGVEPTRTVVVGDDPRDVASAIAAGAIPVVAAWGYGVADSGGLGSACRVANIDALIDWLGLRAI